MTRTRSTKSAAADSAEEPGSKAKYTIPSKTGRPSKLFIFPTKASQESRIVALPHPRHGRPSRYLVCPETGIYEFTKIAAPKLNPRSWLVEAKTEAGNSVNGADETGAKAQIAMGAELFVATHFDPLFLLLPALVDAKSSKSGEEQKRLFLSSDDYFDKLPEESSHLSEITRWPNTRAMLETRMAAICDSVEAGDESMFRLNEHKLLSSVLEKAKRFRDAGLPPSMDEKFVQRALEAPIVIRSTAATNGAAGASDVDSGVTTPKTESAESQSSADGSTFSAASQLSTAATSFTEDASEENITAAISASPQVLELQRLQVAFDFICSSYIPPAIVEQLKQSLRDSDKCDTDFTALDSYSKELERLRSEVMATRCVDNFSRKRMRDEEDDEARQEKKQKLEEEKRKKANESRGVRDLKKVNTTGMKKLSAFFTKR
ncbi:hypothetical protein K4F52_002649 [Lecanicillium sp. MT-2017a]|nr:hypothetical protein K4F52_002649 [Lecanicillium sp. MT-2017a]